ncbi:MAG TPA: hypothetical protein VKA83_09180 [Methylomirabilota bacterium]|nr:hypothetical protein [Methylomirabilota bacterium]
MADEETINVILADSDAVCDCGADPRFVHSLDGWFFEIRQTPTADVAIVRCPLCW